MAVSIRRTLDGQTYTCIYAGPKTRHQRIQNRKGLSYRLLYITIHAFLDVVILGCIQCYAYHKKFTVVTLPGKNTQLNILVSSCTVEFLNNGHITGSRPFVLHMEAVLLQKQRPIYESLGVERGVASVMSANYIY